MTPRTFIWPILKVSQSRSFNGNMNTEEFTKHDPVNNELLSYCRIPIITLFKKSPVLKPNDPSATFKQTMV